jgi:hypothetical protein
MLLRSRGSTCGATPHTGAIGKNSAIGIRCKAPGTGGYIGLEDPSLDSREAQPQWHPRPPAIVRLIDGDPCDPMVAFSLWSIPGRKSLFHDGSDLFLTAQDSHQTLRLILSANIQDGGAFAFSVPGSDPQESWPTASRVSELLKSKRTSSKRPSASRPDRRALVHMRSLQALDGEAAGATHRDIASAIFGESEVWQRWATNSEMRAQVRYFLRRGHQLVEGGYLGLLTKTRSNRKEGGLRTASESP